MIPSRPPYIFGRYPQAESTAARSVPNIGDDTQPSAHNPARKPPSNYNNRKGSRHRLTPQAKSILETWLAKHWLNPYPTEDEKTYLASACSITVTQVGKRIPFASLVLIFAPVPWASRCVRFAAVPIVAPCYGMFG